MFNDSASSRPYGEFLIFYSNSCQSMFITPRNPVGDRCHNTRSKKTSSITSQLKDLRTNDSSAGHWPSSGRFESRIRCLNPCWKSCVKRAFYPLKSPDPWSDTTSATSGNALFPPAKVASTPDYLTSFKSQERSRLSGQKCPSIVLDRLIPYPTEIFPPPVLDPSSSGRVTGQ